MSVGPGNRRTVRQAMDSGDAGTTEKAVRNSPRLAVGISVLVCRSVCAQYGGGGGDPFLVALPRQPDGTRPAGNRWRLRWQT
jgi:hypothetical protein